MDNVIYDIVRNGFKKDVFIYSVIEKDNISLGDLINFVINKDSYCTKYIDSYFEEYENDIIKYIKRYKAQQRFVDSIRNNKNINLRRSIVEILQELEENGVKCVKIDALGCISSIHIDNLKHGIINNWIHTYDIDSNTRKIIEEKLRDLGKRDIKPEDIQKIMYRNKVYYEVNN